MLTHDEARILFRYDSGMYHHPKLGEFPDCEELVARGLLLVATVSGLPVVKTSDAGRVQYQRYMRQYQNAGSA